MRVCPKLVLVFTTVIFNQISRTRCKQKGFKTFYDNFKQSNITTFTVPSGQPYSKDGSKTDYLTQSIKKDFEFPDVEYPLMSRPPNTLGFYYYPNNKFDRKAMTRKNISDLLKRLNALRQAIKNQHKLEYARMSLHSLSDTKLPSFQEPSIFPEVQYPQSALDLISPNARNYMPLYNYELISDDVYSSKTHSLPENEMINYKNISSIISKIINANQDINKINIKTSSKKHIDSLNNKTTLDGPVKKSDHYQNTTLLSLNHTLSKERFNNEGKPDSATLVSDCTDTQPINTKLNYIKQEKNETSSKYSDILKSYSDVTTDYPVIIANFTETTTAPFVDETTTKDDGNIYFITSPPATQDVKIDNGSRSETDVDIIDTSTTVQQMTTEMVTTTAQPYDTTISTSFTDAALIFSSAAANSEVLDTTTTNYINEGGTLSEDVITGHRNADTDFTKSYSELTPTTTTATDDVENVFSFTCTPTIQGEIISSDSEPSIDANILDFSSIILQIPTEMVKTTVQPYHTTISSSFKEPEMIFTSTTAPSEGFDTITKYNINEGIPVSEDISVIPVPVAEFITTRTTSSVDKDFVNDDVPALASRTMSDDQTTQHLNKDMDLTVTSSSPYKLTNTIMTTTKSQLKHTDDSFEVTTIIPEALAEVTITEVNSSLRTTTTSQNILKNTTECIDNDNDLTTDENPDICILDDSTLDYSQSVSTSPDKFTIPSTYTTPTIQDTKTNIDLITTTDFPEIIIDLPTFAPLPPSINDELFNEIMTTTPLPSYTISSILSTDAMTTLDMTTAIPPADVTSIRTNFEDDKAFNLASYNYDSETTSVLPYTEIFQDVSTLPTTVITAVTETLLDLNSPNPITINDVILSDFTSTNFNMRPAIAFTDTTLDMSSDGFTTSNESEITTRFDNLIVTPELTASTTFIKVPEEGVDLLKHATDIDETDLRQAKDKEETKFEILPDNHNGKELALAISPATLNAFDDMINIILTYT